MNTAIAVMLAFIASVQAQPGAKHRETSKYTIGPSVQPMIIIGEGWSQKFTVINTDYYSGDPTVGTLRFYTSAGRPWLLPLRDRTAVDHIDFNLKSGEMLTFETVVSNNAQTLGWALLDLVSDTNNWGLYHAFTVYRKQTAGQPDLMTSVAFVDGLEDEWIIPFDNTGGKYPGVAIVNTSSTSTTSFVLNVVDTTGKTLRTFTKRVSPLNLAWFSLVAEYPELAAAQGQIKMTGGLFSSAVLTLEFAPNGAFAALELKCGGLLFDRHKPPLTRRFVVSIALPFIKSDHARSSTRLV
jgi:hypothetical protein